MRSTIMNESEPKKLFPNFKMQMFQNRNNDIVNIKETDQAWGFEYKKYLFSFSSDI
ncbi:hypothetical protein MRY16398_13250 [Phytobacter sp. MRY16-398]|nr:hypothetical protein MRY16398_13250 [Phytobacter sp. MRY16-398]